MKQILMVIAIYQQADTAQRDAILQAAETIIGKSDLSAGNPSSPTRRRKPDKRTQRP